jgi:hypothetical protein
VLLLLLLFSRATDIKKDAISICVIQCIGPNKEIKTAAEDILGPKHGLV